MSTTRRQTDTLADTGLIPTEPQDDTERRRLRYRYEETYDCATTRLYQWLSQICGHSTIEVGADVYLYGRTSEEWIQIDQEELIQLDGVME